MVKIWLNCLIPKWDVISTTIFVSAHTSLGWVQGETNYRILSTFRVAFAASRLSKLHQLLILVTEIRMWCLLTLGRERLEEKQVVTGCQSQFKPCPRQPDCIFDLLSGDCGHDMTVKCAIQHLAGLFGFKDVLLNPEWFCVLRICFLRWRQCCNSVEFYEAVNGTKATAIREGLQEIVWRTTLSRPVPNTSKFTATESVCCGHTKGVFVLVKLQLVAQTQQHWDMRENL